MMTKYFKMGVLLTIALLPSYLLRFTVAGVPTTLLEIMLVVLIAVWLINNFWRLKELFVVNKRWAVAIALVVLAATVASIVSPNAFAGLGIWKAYFIEPILFFYLLVDSLRNKKLTVNEIYYALFVGGLVVALTAIVQWISGAGIPIPWDIERRVTGVFDYPNALGLYLGPLSVIAAVKLTNWQKDTKNLWFWAVCFVLFVIAIVLAQSEAAIASVVITIFLIGIFNSKLRKKTCALALMAFLFIIIIPSARTFIFQKATLQDYSGQVRLSQWSETTQLLKERPVFGTGLSGYPTALVPFHKNTSVEIFQYPHNIFLNTWVELGILGLLTLLMFVFVIVRSCKPTTVIFLFPLVQMFVHGLVDVPYFKNDLAVMTWIFIALYYYVSEK